MNATEAAGGGQRSRVPVLLLAVVGTLLLLFFAFRVNWFGATLDDAELVVALRTQDSAQAVQHGTEQLVSRFARRDAAALRGDFAEALGALKQHPQWEVRRAAAWAMGHDPSGRNRGALQDMLRDEDRGVRINAAVALANYNDAAGLSELRDALVPFAVIAPVAGKFSTRAKVQEAVSLGRDLGSVTTADGSAPVRVAKNGWVQRMHQADGATVAAGAVLAEIAPDAPTLLNVLLALQLVGTRAEVALIDALRETSPAGKQPEVAAQTERTLEALRRR